MTLLTKQRLREHWSRHYPEATAYMLDCATRPFDARDNGNRGLYELLSYGSACMLARQGGVEGVGSDVAEAYLPRSDGWLWDGQYSGGQRSVLHEMHGIIGLWCLGMHEREVVRANMLNIIGYWEDNFATGWATDKHQLLATALSLMGLPIPQKVANALGGRRMPVTMGKGRDDDRVWYFQVSSPQSWGHAARAYLCDWAMSGKPEDPYGETACLRRNLEEHISVFDGTTPADASGRHDGQQKMRNMRFGYWVWMAKYADYLLRIIATGRLDNRWTTDWDDRAEGSHGLGPMCLAAAGMEVTR